MIKVKSKVLLILWGLLFVVTMPFSSYGADEQIKIAKPDNAIKHSSEYSWLPVHINLISKIKDSGYGLQIGGANMVNSHFNGIQIGILGNCNDGHIGYTDSYEHLGSTFSNGIQISWCNISNLNGIQIGAVNKESYCGIGYIYSKSRDDGFIRGIQIAYSYNMIDTIYGLEIALMNSANSVYGVQVGIINIAESLTGIQIGILNRVGDSWGFPIINWRF